MSKPIFLKIYKNNELLNIQQLTQEHFSIGSNKEIEVHLQGDSILHWHAFIEKRGEDYFLSDLGSPSGTLLNGKKIVESVIQSGDKIQIELFLLEFFIGTPYIKTESPPISSETKKVVKKSKKYTEPKEEIPNFKPPLSDILEGSDFESSSSDVLETSSSFQKTKVQKPSVSKKTDNPINNFHLQDADASSSNSKNAWNSFLPFRESKRTFAPKSRIKNLEEEIPLGKGSIIEVLVAWEDRIISVYHAQKNEIITIGNHSKASIRIPNMVNNTLYNLVQASPVAQVHVGSHMNGKIIRENKSVSFKVAIEKGVMSKTASGYGISLGRNEVICVHLSSSLHVYIRYTILKAKAQPGALFGFNESELVGLGLSACFMLMLFFFFGVYYPSLIDEEKLEEKKIRTVVIQIKPPPKKIVRLAERVKKKVQPSKKKNIPIKVRKPIPKKKAPPQIKKKARSKGRIGAVSAKKKKSQLKVVTSSRSKGSPIKTKKPGSGAGSPKPDPNKVGLLGVFGKSGLQKQLDKVYSGAGELGGLADQATGSSGTIDTYMGDDLGTKLKSAGSGGKGSNIIGISGVSTRGKGGGTKGYGRGGGLGHRGSIDLSFGISEIDVEGNLDKQAIFRIVQAHKAQLARCHSSVLQNNPSIRGRLKVKWTIDNGVVTNISVVDNGSGSSELARCVMGRLKNWKFPGVVPQGGVGVVEYPFVFVGS